MRKRTPWTPEREAMLRRLACEGKSTKEAAEILGVTVHAVCSFASLASVKFSSRASAKSAKEAAVRFMLARGDTAADIAAALKTTTGSLQNFCSIAGISLARARKPAPTTEPEGRV